MWWYRTMNTEKDKALIHGRVSTNKQSAEGESLETQEKICRKIVKERGWELAHEPWLETFSGRKDDRPVFEEILNFIDSKPGEIRYYVFRNIDRFTRKGAQVYSEMKKELTKRGVQMVDSMGVIQPPKNTLEDLGFEYDWSVQFPSEISEVVIATNARQEATSILTRMIGQEIRLTQRGYKIRAPQDGYLNKKVYVEGKKRTIQVPDPKRAKYFIAMFKMRATNQYTDKEIVDRINAMGYRTKMKNRWSKDKESKRIVGQVGGCLLTVKSFQRIIKRPIYCGVVVEKWTKNLPVKAPYDGLVSIQIFNQANRGKVVIVENGDSLELRYGDNKKRRLKNNPLFPYKIFGCPECGSNMLGSSSTGKSGKKFPAYHCSRNHKRIGFSKAEFEETIAEYINALEFQPEILLALHAVLVNKYRERQSEIIKVASEVGHNVADLELRKATALKGYLDAKTEVLKNELEKEIGKLDTLIKKTRKERNKLEITETDIESFIKEAKTIMEHPAKILLDTSNLDRQKALFGLVFEEIPSYQEIRNGTPKLTWIFKVSSSYEMTESQLVTLRGIEPRFRP